MNAHHPVAPRIQTLPVVIVGAGPVGLYAAARLATFGTPSLVLEQRPRPLKQGSKALCMQCDVIELLDNVGCRQEIIEKGCPWNVSRTFVRDTEIGTLHFPSTSLGTPAFVNIPQWMTEKILYEKAIASSRVDVRWAHEVVSVDQTDEDVTIEIETPEGRRFIRARYVLACDGVNSRVREQLGIRWLGRVHADRFLIADVRAKVPWPRERRFWFDPPSNRGRQIVIHPQPDDLWRIDWQLTPTTDLATEQANGRLAQRVRDLVGDVDFDLDWVSTYRFHQRLAERLVTGRILLLGDAAHALPPFGARGMNSGLQDAENAVWKIAAVLNGQANSDLVETYHEERHLAGRINVAITGRTIRFMVPSTRVHRFARNLLLRASISLPVLRRRVNSGRMSEPADYAGCSTIPGNPHALPTEPAKRSRSDKSRASTPHRAAGSRTGKLIENVRVGETSLRTLCADGFLCLADGRTADAHALARANRAGKLPSIVRLLVVGWPDAESGVSELGSSISPDQVSALQQLFDEGRASAILVRPDGYITGTSVGEPLEMIEQALAACRFDGPHQRQRGDAAPLWSGSPVLQRVPEQVLG